MSFVRAELLCLMTITLVVFAAPFTKGVYGQDKPAEKKSAEKSNGLEKNRDPFADPLNRDPFQQDPFAQKPDAKKPIAKPSNKESKKGSASEKNSLTDELDLYEKELDELERLGAYGNDSILKIARNLESEYLKNKATQERLQKEDEHTAKRLLARQRLIPLYLWQLQRVGNQIRSTERLGTSTRTRIRELMKENKDSAVSKRYSALMRRSSELSTLRTTSTYDTSFFFATPGESRTGLKFENPFANPLLGQKPKPRVVVNQFTKHRAELNRLLKLVWKDGSLVWDRGHWSEPFLGKKLSEIQKEVDALLVDNGITPPKKRMILPWGSPIDRPYSILLFENLKRAAESGKRRSLSFTQMMGGGDNRKRFSNESFECGIGVQGKEVDLFIREFDGKRRTLQVTSTDTKDLRICVTMADRILLLSQKKSGEVRLVDDTDTETVSLRAPSLAALYLNHPDAIEERFLAVLRELSFLLPPMRFEKPTIDRVLKHIVAEDANTAKQFKELMDEVDSASFAIRAKATKTLQRNIDRFLPMLIKTEAVDDLPLEVSGRLEQVMSQYTQDERGIDSMILAMQLTDDVDYLIEALSQTERGDQQEIIATKLGELTGQNYGSDTEKWENWRSSRESKETP